ncbi:MAG: hypothetical protein Q8P45_00975 [Candidatus Harrisonbacteria bacterium]|nr:hypothetical protein [Candidatus Harrisonbacteria bacterium]
MQTNEEAVLCHLARKAGGGRRVKDLRAFFTAFREEDSQHESIRQLMSDDEKPAAWQGESSNERNGF